MFTAACLQVLTLLRDLCTLLFFFFSFFIRKTLKAEMNLWVSGVGLTWASLLLQVLVTNAAEPCWKWRFICMLLVWDPLMGLWRNVRMKWGCDLLLSMKWHSRKYDCPTAILLYEVCLSLLLGQQNWFTRLSNVIQRKSTGFHVRNSSSEAYFPHLLIHYKHITPKFCFCFFFL